GGCQRRRCRNIRTVFAALGILVKSTADLAGRIVGRSPRRTCGTHRELRSLKSSLGGSETSKSGRRSRDRKSCAHDQSCSLHCAMDTGFHGGGCSAQAFHRGGCHKRNGEIEKNREKGGKGHDEWEVKPVLNYDHVLCRLNEAACCDRQEKHVADKL